MMYCIEWCEKFKLVVEIKKVEIKVYIFIIKKFKLNMEYDVWVLVFVFGILFLEFGEEKVLEGIF